MADEIIIETTSQEVITVGVPGPQGPAGAAGTGLETLTTQGDTLYRGASTGERLPIGSAGQVLKVVNGLPAWANESGAVTSVNGATGAVTVAAATHGANHYDSGDLIYNEMVRVDDAGFAGVNGVYYVADDGGDYDFIKIGSRSLFKLVFEDSRWKLKRQDTTYYQSQTYANAPQPWNATGWTSISSQHNPVPSVLQADAVYAVDNLARNTQFASGLPALGSTGNLPVKTGSGGVIEAGAFGVPVALAAAAAEGTSSSFARADHVHSAEVSDSAFRVLGSTDATKKVAIEVDANVPANTTVTLTVPSSGGTIALAGAAPSAHAASHAATGSDPLSPSDIGAQSVFITEDLGTINANVTLTAARAKIYTVTVNTFDTPTPSVQLPTTGIIAGDVVQIRFTTFTGREMPIRRDSDFFGPSMKNGERRTYIAASTAANSWDNAGIDTHTHAASAITSGTLDIARIPTGTSGTTVALGNHTHTPSEVGLGNVSNTAQVTSVSGTAPIVSSGGTTPTISVTTGTTTGTVAAGDDSRFHTRSHAMTGTSDHTASNWSVFYSNGSGQVTELALGAANTVLTSNGASSAPSFAAASGGGVTGAASSASDVLGVSGANITGVDAGSADRLVFWDDSASKLTYLEAGSGLSISGTTLTATASGGSKTYAVFTAEHNQPPATAFATLDTRNSIAVLDFDAATDENAVFVGIMPEASSLGSGLIVRLHWMATSATSGNVRWGVQFERSNTDLDADSFDTAVEATAATNGTSGIITTTAITVTTIDGITAGDVFRLKVFRNADDATNDTMTGDAELVAVEVRSAA